MNKLTWSYEEDTGEVFCCCPVCSGRLHIGVYTYRNPYKYCPYCGTKLEEGKLDNKRAQVYGGNEDE